MRAGLGGAGRHSARKRLNPTKWTAEALSVNWFVALKQQRQNVLEQSALGRQQTASGDSNKTSRSGYSQVDKKYAFVFLEIGFDCP